MIFYGGKSIGTFPRNILYLVDLIKHYQSALKALKVPLAGGLEGENPTFMWKFLIGPRNETFSGSNVSREEA